MTDIESGGAPDAIAAIRERWAAVTDEQWQSYLNHMIFCVCYGITVEDFMTKNREDTAALLAEVDRLREAIKAVLILADILVSRHDGITESDMRRLIRVARAALADKGGAP